MWGRPMLLLRVTRGRPARHDIPNEPDSPYTSSRSRLCRKIHNVCCSKSNTIAHFYGIYGGMEVSVRAAAPGPPPAPVRAGCGVC